MLNTCLSREGTIEDEHTVASICCSKNVFLSIGATGVISVRDGTTFALQNHLNLHQIVILRDLASEDGVNPPILSPLSHFRIVCSQPGRQTGCHSRHVVVGLAVPELPLPDANAAPVDPKKKKPPAKGAPTEAEKRVLFRVLVLDILNNVDAGGESVHSIKVVHEILLESNSTYTVPAEGAVVKADPACDSKNLNVNKEMFDGFWADLSLDGGLLSVVCSSLSGGCKVFALEANCVAAPAPDSEAIPLQLAKASLAAVIPASCPFLQGSRIRNAVILPDYSADEVAAVTPMSAEERMVSQARSTLLITLYQAPRCLLIGFRAKSKSELEAMAQAAATAAAAGAKGKPAQPSDTRSADDAPLFDVCPLTKWALTASLTAFALDVQKRVLLATGCSDGTVELWNMPRRSLIDTLGRHRGVPVTCLCVRRDPVSSLASLCDARVAVTSGAADGTLCFYTAGTDNSGAEHVRLVDYRYDAHNAAVLSITETLSTAVNEGDPMLLVHYSCGALAVYLSKTRELIGRAEKRERIDYRNVFTSFHSWRSLPVFEDPPKKAAALRAAEEAAALAAQEAEAQRILAAQQAAAEAEKAAKAAAGKAGKSGAAVTEVPVPVEEPEPEPVEVIPEPYVYVPREEDTKEQQIDVQPYDEVKHLIGTGNESALWQTRSCIAALSATHVACVGNRAGQPCVVLYNLQAMLAASVASTKQAMEPIGAVAQRATSASPMKGASSQLNRTASKAPVSAAGTGQGRTTVMQAQEAPKQQQQQLRLTEARLQQLENTFPALQAQQAPAAALKQGTIAPPAVLTVDPAALARNSVLRSRTEKTSRKTSLLNNVSALSGILQAAAVPATAIPS